jgi:hypothetical protein
MDAQSPVVRVIRRRCAPKTFPCPTCGQRGRRKDTHIRTRALPAAVRGPVLLRLFARLAARCLAVVIGDSFGGRVLMQDWRRTEDVSDRGGGNRYDRAELQGP